MQKSYAVPNYTPDFLDKVADQYDAKTYGPETAQAISDWSIMISR